MEGERERKKNRGRKVSQKKRLNVKIPLLYNADELIQTFLWDYTLNGLF